MAAMCSVLSTCVRYNYRALYMKELTIIKLGNKKKRGRGGRGGVLLTSKTRMSFVSHVMRQEVSCEVGSRQAMISDKVRDISASASQQLSFYSYFIWLL